MSKEDLNTMDQEKYIESLGKIIERDYFPDLPKLRVLSSLNTINDAAIDAVNKLEFPTERSNSPSDLHLDEFHSKVISEDSASFNDLLQIQNEQLRERFPWAFASHENKKTSEGNNLKAITDGSHDGSVKMLTDGTSPAFSVTSSVTSSRPLTEIVLKETFSSSTKSQSLHDLMPPPSISRQNTHILPSVLHSTPIDNSKLQSQTEKSLSLSSSTSESVISSELLHTPIFTPRVHSSSALSDPSSSTSSSTSGAIPVTPFMTWGVIPVTPTILPSNTPLHTPRLSALPETPLRDDKAFVLALKARAKAQKRGVELPGMSRKSHFTAEKRLGAERTRGKSKRKTLLEKMEAGRALTEGMMTIRKAEKEENEEASLKQDQLAKLKQQLSNNRTTPSLMSGLSPAAKRFVLTKTPLRRGIIANKAKHQTK